MKTTHKLTAFVFAAVIALTSVQSYANDMVINEGVEAGKFTQDYDAAMAQAKEKDLPVMLVFTGSDWCGWCKVMDKNVFSQPAWSDYAKDNLVQVWVDFPKDKSLVPEKFHARNKTLSQKYGVRGYPTYVILGSTGNKLGQLSAGKTKTPASFKVEMQKLLVMTKNGIKAYCATLKPEDAKKIMKTYTVVNELKKKQAEVNTKLDTESKALKDAMVATFLKKNARVKPTPALREEFGMLNKAVQDAKTKLDSF